MFKNGTEFIAIPAETAKRVTKTLRKDPEFHIQKWVAARLEQACDEWEAQHDGE